MRQRVRLATLMTLGLVMVGLVMVGVLLFVTFIYFWLG
jgi:hypothetical protein